MRTPEIISGRDNYVGLSFSFFFFGGGGGMELGSGAWGVARTVCFNNFTAILD